MRKLLTTLLTLLVFAVALPAVAGDDQKVEVEVVGYCIKDQNGVGLAYADFVHPGFATFTLNGQPIVGDHAGVNAKFGENSWTAEAKPGFKLKGDKEGTFSIDECGNPGTTTTTIPEITTTAPTTTTLPAETTAPSLPEIIVDPPAETTTTERLVELPFTGIDPGFGFLAGLALLGLGGLLVRRSDA